MNTLTHSAAQAFGWVLGALAACVSTVLLLSARKAFTSPIGRLSLKQQHRLFRDYWKHLERKQRYEEMQELEPVMLVYRDKKQPSRKQLKPYRLVTKKTAKLKENGLKFITKRHIEKA